MRIKLLLSYNGSSFEGSQVQKHTDNTIMGALYAAFGTLNISTKLHFSGRTDAGVHAAKQVAHCDIPDYWDNLFRLQRHLQGCLPGTIRIRRLERVCEDFHARYSAQRRAYRYVLSNKTANPFEAPCVTFIQEEINLPLLTKALSSFEGTHDFTHFRKSGSGIKTDVRTIYKTRCYTFKDKTVLYIEANGFLRSQIRLMVAFLLQVNAGKLSIENLLEQVEGKKVYIKKPAEPNGLYLSNIIY